MPNTPQPPIAHADNAPDPYAWLQQRDTPQVLAYLNAENAYQQACLADQAPLREQLFEEIKGRIRKPTCRCPPLGPVPVLHPHHSRR